jgi:nucleotide-binding universal stress UspA family protein
MSQEKDPLKVALVALDLTDMDDYLIHYMAMLNRYLQFERIFFVHIAKDLELPEEVLKKYPDLLAPLDESIESDIQKKIDEHFVETNTALNILIQDGIPMERLLHLTKVKEADLIVMGRKESLKGSGLVTSHIARNSPCSLLLVTPTWQDAIRKILVPVDFSEHCAFSLKRVLGFSDQLNVEVVTSHVYRVPTGYSKIGKSFEEFGEIMKGHAEKDYRRFLKMNDIRDDIPCEFILDTDHQNVELIYNLAEKEKADLIVVGSKGRTNASALFIGSFAEKMAYRDNHIPVLILKHKGENMGFLETLLRI